MNLNLKLRSPQPKTTQGGLVGLVIVLIVLILTASYFGVNIRKVAESDMSKSNFGYVKEVSLNFWHKYLEKPIMYLYGDIWLNLLWHPLVNVLQKEQSSIKPPEINLTSTDIYQ